MAIITDAEYKTYRGISGTDYDAVLAVINPAVQVRIESYCDRLFTSASRTENYSGDGSQILIVQQWPITAITSITIDSTVLTTATDYAIAERMNGGIYRLPFDSSVGFGSVDQWGVPVRQSAIGYHKSPHWPEGYDNIEVIYTAGYVTAPDDLKLLMFEMIDDQLNARGDSWRLAAVGEGAETKTMRAAIDMKQRYRDMLAPFRRTP